MGYSIGIVAMSYGDGFAPLIDNIYGSRTYKIFQDTKSMEGSINLPVIAGVALIATIVEAITPKEADNLTVSLASALLYSAIV